MNIQEILILFSALFCGCIAAFPALATKHQWPRGNVYERGYSSIIFIVVMLGAAGYIGIMAYQEKTSWLMLLWLLIATFFGPALVPAIFGRLAGMTSLLASPVLLIAGIYLTDF